MFAKTLLLGALTLLSATATQAYETGLDVSALTSTSSWSCARNLGYDYPIIRCWFEAYGQNPGGALDKNCLQNYKNALAAGYSSVDVYMFPCSGRSTCKSPDTQVKELSSFIDSNGMKVGRIWLDVEIDPAANNWPSPADAKTTLKAYKTALDASGKSWGVYASKSQWSSIIGDLSWELDASVPLWYPHYDDVLSFDDFSSFGGWTKPTIKQYSGSVTFCSAGWDRNYYG
ncbi:glycoside hydrolase superfamily [Dichotomocladium elegans]|nr:glycoside hydrolase superfamily [Dichotomocladium elegans]